MATRDDNDALKDGTLAPDPAAGARPFVPGELEAEARRRREASRPAAAASSPDASPADKQNGYGKKGGKKQQTESQADQLVKLAQSSARELFIDTVDAQTSYAQVPVNGHLELVDVGSEEFKDWLAGRFWKSKKKSAGGTALADAVRLLRCVARYENEGKKVHVRVANTGDAVYLDLGDQAWRAVKITAEGWKVVKKPPVFFRRPEGYEELPEPVPGGSLDELRDLVNVPDDNSWTLVKTWLVGALRGCGPYLILVVQGERGSAKSTLSKMLRGLVDPNAIPLRRPPDSDRDFAIAAHVQHVCGYDNLSGVKPWLSDALCCLATGAGFATRSLYKNKQEALFRFVAPALLNGIDDMLTRGDLADRSVVVQLPRITKRERRDEATIWWRYRELQPRLLGALCDAVSCALRRERDVQLPQAPRMADAVRWATAAEPALGIDPGGVLAAVEANLKESIAQGLEAEPITGVLLRMPREFWGPHRRWEGRASELLEELRHAADEAEVRSKRWPSCPALFGRILKRISPSLIQAGVEVRLIRSHGARKVVLQELTQEEVDAA